MKKSALLLSLVCLSACSSIIEGRHQQLTINTNPAGAKCDLHRQELVIGMVAETPGSVLIEKTKYDIRVVCNKEGYQEATYLNHSGAAGATWGNIVAGGVIGWGIDSASGADNKYETPMNITLVPEEKEEKKPAKKSKKAKANVKEEPAKVEPKAETKPASEDEKESDKETDK